MRAMGTMLAAAVLIFGGAIAATPARANDSVAEVAIGGLTLTKTDAISMDSEDLYISRDTVRVKYRFTNTTDSPIHTLVAFPLPDIPPDPYFVTTAPPFWSELNFKTSVDGQPVALHLVEQAFFKGEDVSARLSALHIPLGGKFGPGLGEADFDAAIDRLPAAKRNRLHADGLISYAPGDLDVPGWSDIPGWRQKWTVRMMWTRHQTFPPRNTITVEHEYTPRASSGASGRGCCLDPYHRSANWNPGQFAEQRREYCIDDSWVRSLDKKLESAGSQSAGGITIGYVLTTGAHWKGPIGNFRLVVDNCKPDTLVSFCAEGVKQISPTQFEVRHTNFTPTEDLHILFIDFPDSSPKTAGSRKSN